MPTLVALNEDKYFLGVVDFLFLTISSFLFSYCSHMLFFPNFRPYMLIGVFSGFFGYLKSFNIILAKSIKKFYNRIVSREGIPCFFMIC